MSKKHKLSDKLEKFLASYDKEDFLFNSMSDHDFALLFSDYLDPNGIGKHYDFDPKFPGLNEGDVTEILHVLWHNSSLLDEVADNGDKHEFLRVVESTLASSKVYFSLEELEKNFKGDFRCKNGNFKKGNKICDSIEESNPNVLACFDFEEPSTPGVSKNLDHRYLVVINED